MNEPKLKTYKIIKYSFNNTMQSGMTVKLETKCSYNVKYTQNSTCRAELGIETLDREHPDALSVTATVIGVFEIDESMAKEDIHVKSFNQLFPILRANISMMTSACGFPPVIIPMVDISNQDIYRINLNPGNKQ